jgi:hypothetical protein
MAAFDAEDRVYQAFLRGYRESAAGKVGVAAGASVLPYAALIQTGLLESKELRRSIEACRGALAQLAALPGPEQEQLKIEARASLEALQSATERLLARLRGLRAGDAAPAAPVAGEASTAKRAAPAPTRKARRRK